MLSLESFAGRLWLYLNANEKFMFLEDRMDVSLGTGEVELVLDLIRRAPYDDISL